MTVLNAGPLAKVPPGQALRVEHEPPIAIFRTDDGQLFAIDDTCTHQDASLADGWLEGCLVECPLHSSRFDLRTGQVDAPPATLPVRVHDAYVVDDMINVRLSSDVAQEAPRPAPRPVPRSQP